MRIHTQKPGKSTNEVEAQIVRFVSARTYMHAIPSFPAVSPSPVIWCGVEERSIKRKFNCLSVSDATNWKQNKLLPISKQCFIWAGSLKGPGRLLLLLLFDYYWAWAFLGELLGFCGLRNGPISTWARFYQIFCTLK